MEYILLGLGIVLLILCGYLLVSFRREAAERKTRLEELNREFTGLREQQLKVQAEGLRLATESVHKMVNESMRTLGQNLSEKLTTQKTSMDSTQKVVQQVSRQLGELGASTSKIQEIGKEIRSLSDVLKAPKLRGNLGEFLMEDLLRSMLPASHLQIPSTFQDGKSVDGAILLSGKKIPIDSKFPLESFQRMVQSRNDAERATQRKEFLRSFKARVDEIADNYLRPEEGTYEFGLLYLPSEAIYYELIVREEAGDRSPFHYAINKKIIPVSPGTLFAYLQTISFGLKGLQIEKEAEEIRDRVAQFQRQFGNFLKILGGIDKHFLQVQKKFEEALGKGKRLNERMGKISGQLPGAEGTESLLREGDSYELPSPSTEKIN